MTTSLPIKISGKLNREISLQLLSPTSLLVNDDNSSILLKISHQEGILLSPENTTDLTDSIPDHLLAAALDYCYTNNRSLNSVSLSPEISERLSGLKFIHHFKDSLANNIRTGFYQDRTLWHWQKNDFVTPEIWTENSKGVEHPIRQEQPTGVVYERYDYQNDITISFRTIDPEEDIDLFHGWMNQPRVAVFWEMNKCHTELQEYLKSLLNDRRTWPLIGCFNDEPFGYFELYWAMEDRIAPYYDCQPWDRGLHQLVGNKKFLGRRFSDIWTKSITHFLYLDDPRTSRLVGEPRADHQKALKILKPAAWSVVKEFDFPHKRAALVNSHRRTFFQEVRL